MVSKHFCVKLLLKWTPQIHVLQYTLTWRHWVVFTGKKETNQSTNPTKPANQTHQPTNPTKPANQIHQPTQPTNIQEDFKLSVCNENEAEKKKNIEGVGVTCSKEPQVWTLSLCTWGAQSTRWGTRCPTWTVFFQRIIILHEDLVCNMQSSIWISSLRLECSKNKIRMN